MLISLTDDQIQPTDTNSGSGTVVSASPVSPTVATTQTTATPQSPTPISSAPTSPLVDPIPTKGVVATVTQSINDFLGGYTTQQIQGMTDAQRSALYGQVQSQYGITDNGSGLYGSGISGNAYDVFNYLKTLVSSDTLPSIKQAALMPAYLTPGDKSGNKTLMDLLGLSANYNPDGGTGEVGVATSGTTGAPVGGGTTASPTTGGGTSSGGTTGASDGGAAVNRLIDLASMMFGSAGTQGGGDGFGGLVSGPIASTPENTGNLATPTGSSHVALFVFLAIGVAVTYWYYKKHHHKKAA